MMIVYNVVMVLCLLFSLYFGITGLFAFKKIKYHHKNTKNNKFAILIPCRNEEAVIGNLRCLSVDVNNETRTHIHWIGG